MVLRGAIIDAVPEIADFAFPERWGDDDVSGPSAILGVAPAEVWNAEDGSVAGGDFEVRLELSASPGTAAGEYFADARRSVRGFLDSSPALMGALSRFFPSFAWTFSGEEAAEPAGSEFVSAFSGTLALGSIPEMEE